MNTTKKTSEIIYTSGKQFFDELIQDINHAKNSINLETYIFENDHLGQTVANELASAAKRGVNVKLLADGAGVRHWKATLRRLFRDAGVETRIFHPFPWRLWQWSRSVVRMNWLLKSAYFMLKMNSRNHRKVCIIDGEIAYIGSMNISACHLTVEQGGANWRDTAVRIQDSDINDLIKAFNSAWTHNLISERVKTIFKHVRTNPRFRLNHTRHRRRILYKNLLRRIDDCNQRIWITNAYFVPDNFLLTKLKDAANRGVDVRILLPMKSDVLIMPWASASFYYTLLKSGVRIFEYTPSMLHAKSLILDDWMSVGSSNLNYRSLLHDLEVDVNIRLPESKQKLELQFIEDIKQSNEITLEAWRPKPIHQRILGYSLLYMKYWI